MSEPIRILHVLQRMEPAGVQSFLMNIYRCIDRDKIQFDFLVHYTEPQAYDHEIESLGGHVYKLSFREDKNLIKYRHDLSSFFSNHPEYQIVHGHMDSLGVIYLGEAKRAGIQNRIAHAHTVLIDNAPKKKVRHVLNRSFKKNATQLFACSDEAGRYMFGSSPFYVIKNPIDVGRFAYDQQVRKEVRIELGVDGKHVVGHVGRFADAKNHEFLLKVFKRIYENDTNAVLLLVGDGENREKIASLAHELGIYGAVLFTGNRKDVERIYQAMDIFVFPSLYEGLGIAVIEAQTSGLPVICSDRIPGIAHVTEQCRALPLSAGINTWAQTIMCQIESSKGRYDRSIEVRAAGYDISAVSGELMAEYVKILGGGGTSL